ncbi:FtsH protease activity modulator HflK [Hyphomicrobium methylovorum]|uniref:FtsH protease activity modulator HflK n=1 Tax=Hyphomicrobium methylovorum TaxID=84 RepID=UPI0015E67CB9|nr:FtsH protease activity modulator HflK [Hyphomicrobium methylovorum]MBA2126587.1 FtsH protease activity modulator HflK [Hyphomicrobium methylovorum]
MPWSSQGGGGSSGGGGGNGGRKGGGPWGQGPWGSGGGGGGGKEPPDLDEILRRGQDRMRQVMRGGGGGNGSGGGSLGGGVPKPFIFLVSMLLLAGVAFYGFFFRVNPDEQGIVLRFGKFDRWEPAGLHFRWPYPIEEVRLPKVTQQRTIEVGSARSAIGARDSGLMLTGDGSVVDVRFVVFWRISPERDEKTGETGVEQFLFNIAAPETTVREVAESAMREVVGQSNLQPLLTGGRQQTQEEVQKLMQRTLNYYRAGIKIDQVQLKEVDPPEEVVGDFRAVAAAAQEKETLIKQAQTYADQVTPRARGDADRILAAAEGYRDQTVAEATGQAARFEKVYEEYKKAPDVTRDRLFLEMQERVLGGADKIILDQKQGGQGVVPFLPLDQIQKRVSEPAEGER